MGRLEDRTGPFEQFRRKSEGTSLSGVHPRNKMGAEQRREKPILREWDVAKDEGKAMK